jgi:hypothetical protein
MKSFIFEKTTKEGEIVRRHVDLDSIVYVEEVKAVTKDEEGNEQKIHYADIHLSVVHDMQFVKKQSIKGTPQEFTYAKVPMTLKVTDAEIIDRLFAELYGK